MNKIESLWEDRSKKYKTDLRGVLPKSFPFWLNGLLHRWMFNQIKKTIKNGDKVLDLGCGYGRLALEITKNFNKSKVFGVDISKTYVDLFNKNIKNQGKAYKSSITKLPFKNNTFDVVYMVTTLMYLTDEKTQLKALEEIFRVLKRNGKYIFIERNPVGFSIITLGGLITKIRGSKNKEIESVSFKQKEMSNLIKKSGSKLISNDSFPFGWFVQPSWYISYFGKKI